MVLFPVPYEQVLAEERRIEAQLQRYGLKRVPISGDGNCQFRALASFFADSRINHSTLRKMIVRLIWQHREHFRTDIENSYGVDVAHYCQRMNRDGEWGDGITLQAFGMLFRINVWLFMPDGVSQLHSYSDALNVAVVRRGEHYDAATAIDASDADEPLQGL